MSPLRIYANGFKTKRYQTGIGALKLSIPQVLWLKFYPRSLERGPHSEQALKLAVAEMYILGVSTRKVSQITELLCGFEISSSQVSRLSREMDETLEKFRTRSLQDEYPFVYLDALYESVRYGGHIQDMAVLIAVGVNRRTGKRKILGVEAQLSEAEVHWRTLLKQLAKRGLQGIRLFISDDHPGLKAARKTVFPEVPWQRCQFHMSQNAQHYAPKVALRAEIAQAMRDIFNSPDRDRAMAMVNDVKAFFKESAPDFVQWLDENIEDGFAVY